MIKGASINKFKYFCTVFFLALINVCKFLNNLTHHLLIKIPNMYWKGFHHLNYKQQPLLILSHMDCLIHQLLVLMEQHFAP
jgi:hypothetical protein